MKAVFAEDPDLETYYDWKLFVEGNGPSEYKNTEVLNPCGVHQIIDTVHNKLGIKTLMIEAGPSTAFE